nr:glycosyltransferase [bacterium]
MATHFVLQWARLGDLFQTRPLLARIRARDPEATILLCVDEMYRSLTSTFPEVDKVVGIPLRHYWALAKTERNLETLFEAFQKLPEISGAAKPDIAYVLNNSAAAAYFAKLLHAKETRGFFSSGDAHDPPMIYLDTMLADGDASSAHLADLWAALAGASITNMDFPPNLAEYFQTSQKFAGKTLGILVGAGDPARTWPAESWCQFLSLFEKYHPGSNLLLLGTQKDAELARQIEHYCQRTHFHVTNLTGKTELLVLGSILKSCDLITGPDTGSLHYAAVLGVPVLGLYFAGARAAYTGPYAASACVLEGKTESLSPLPKDAAHIVTALLSRKDSEQVTLAPEFVLRHPVLDNDGLLYLSPQELNDIASDNREHFWRRVTFPYKQNKVKLSIIIPCAGQWHLTKECLEAIAEECQDIPMEILIVSPASSKDNDSLPTLSCSLKIIRVPQDSSFSEACNRGATEANGELLLFLNNDTIPENGWLTSLLRSYSETSPCILSPLLLYWDGLVQNAGVLIEGNSIEEIAHETWPKQPDDIRECDAVSATAMLVSKEQFQKLGGFDERFINGYEDLDFCLRAKEHHIHCRVDTHAKVTHFRGSTPGRFRCEDTNRTRFFEKWMPRHVKNKPPASSIEFSTNIHTDNLPLATVVCAEDAHSAGSRIRWAGPLARLEQKKLLRSYWHVPDDSNESWEYLEKNLTASALVILRRPLRTPQENYKLLDEIKRAKIPLIVDVDDLVIGRFASHTTRGQALRVYEESFQALLDCANVVTVSTPSLAENMKQYSSAVHVLSNTIDSRWWPKAQQRAVKTDTFNIGFFGSPAHGLDLASIAEALKRFLDEEEGKARFYTWGAFPEILRTHEAVRQGGAFVSNYEVHLQRLASVPIHAAVVPLMDTIANRCRSVIRFLELGWYGIPGIYSRIGEFERHIKD